MFTGIVEDNAQVIDVEQRGEGKTITLRSELLEEMEKGGSVSISGACLTLEDPDKKEFFLAEETLEKTWFDSIEEGDEVNLELPLTPEEKMGGHYVQGHVEETIDILEIEELEEGWNIWFEMPATPFVVKKGFVAIEGISLTVAEFEEDRFSVTIIPETWRKTNLSKKTEGEKVNFEADVMARYAQSVTD